MSKKAKAITLEMFLKMSEAEQQALPSKQYLQLLAEKEDAEDAAFAATLKTKYKVPHVYVLKVEDAKGYVKGVDRSIMSMVMATGKGAIEQCETLLENIWLEGDSRLKDDDEYFLGAINQLKAMMYVKVGSLKKY